MKYSAAYTLCVLGGNATPSAADLEKVITACGGECDAEAAEKLVSELSAKVRGSPTFFSSWSGDLSAEGCTASSACGPLVFGASRLCPAYPSLVLTSPVVVGLLPRLVRGAGPPR